MNKPSAQPRANEMEDHYVAELLQRFGDADEAARKQWTQSQQTHPTQQHHEPVQEDGVSLSNVCSHAFENKSFPRRLFMKSNNYFAVVFMR